MLGHVISAPGFQFVSFLIKTADSTLFNFLEKIMFGKHFSELNTQVSIDPRKFLVNFGLM